MKHHAMKPGPRNEKRPGDNATTITDLVCNNETKVEKKMGEENKKKRNFAKKNLIVTRDKHCMKWSLPYSGSYPVLKAPTKLLLCAIQPRKPKDGKKYDQGKQLRKEMSKIQQWQHKNQVEGMKRARQVSTSKKKQKEENNCTNHKIGVY